MCGAPGSGCLHDGIGISQFAVVGRLDDLAVDVIDHGMRAGNQDGSGYVWWQSIQRYGDGRQEIGPKLFACLRQASPDNEAAWLKPFYVLSQSRREALGMDGHMVGADLLLAFFLQTAPVPAFDGIGDHAVSCCV